MKTCLYLDSRWNLCFTLTITTSVSWEIWQNLTIFFVSFPVKVTWKGVFFTKFAGCFLPTVILPKMDFFCRSFFKFLTKSANQSLIDRYFYLLLFHWSYFERKSLFYWINPTKFILPLIREHPLLKENLIHFLQMASR